MFSKQSYRYLINVTMIIALLLATSPVWPCTPVPPAKPKQTGKQCNDGPKGPTGDAATRPGMLVICTGALREIQTDLAITGTGLSYHLTRTYTNRFDDNPAINYKGDLGWNWASRDLIRLAVETADPSGGAPLAIRICYDTSQERVLHKASDSPLKYSRDSGNPADADVYDVLDQEAIGGVTYWRLTKPTGHRFYFLPLNLAWKGGRLAFERDASGNQITYTYGADGKPSTITDTAGDEINFTYYPAGDGRAGLIKTAQWVYDGNTRQTVYYAYDDQQNLCRVTVVASGVQRTTLYVYAKGTGDTHLEHNLLYMVAPEQYEAMQDANIQTLQPGTHYLKDENVLDGSVVYDPDAVSFPAGKSWSDYAYRRFQYGTNSANSDYDRVNQEVLSNGAQVTYAYTVNPGTGDGLPADLVGVVTMLGTVTQADGFVEKEFVDNLGRLRYRIESDGTRTEATRTDIDANGRMTAVTYPDGRKMRSIYMTGYNPDTDAQSGDATEYPAYSVIEYTEDSTVKRRVLAHYTYGVAGRPDLPLTSVAYTTGVNDDLGSTEGVDKFTTDYAYNSAGAVVYQVSPKTNGLLPGAGSAQDYRLGVEYTYNSAGQVVYEKRFICDAYTPGSQGAAGSFTNRADQTQTKNEYYATGAANGLLRYVTVDEGEGKLNLKTEYQFDNYRNPSATVVDPAGLAITTSYSYDPTGRLLSTTSPGGYYTESTYDASGQLTEVARYTSSNKQVQLAKTVYVYDLYGRQTIVRQWYGSGVNDYAESYVTYDSLGRVENQIGPPDANGNRHGSKVTYDQWGHVTQTAVGGVWSGTQTGSWSANPDVVSKTSFVTGYYGEGLVDASKDGYDDNASVSTYDARARMASSIRKKSDANYGDGGTLRTLLASEYTYGDRGMVTKVINKETDGTEINESTTTFDGMGRAKAQAIGDGTNSLTSTFEYDAQGRTWRVTDASGNNTVTEYDAAGRQTKVTDGDGNIVVTVYDAANRVTKVIRKDHKPGAGTADSDYLWYVVSYTFDSEGRTATVVNEGEDTDRNGSGNGPNLTTAFHYYDSAFSATVVTTDPASHHTKTIADGLGRQIWLREGGSGTLPNETYARETRFDYDPAGRQTAIVSGGPDGVVGTGSDDQTTSYTYTNAGQVASVVYPDSGTVSYSYFAGNGALATVTDQKSIVTSSTYKAVADGNNYRLESRQYVSSGTPDGGDRDFITVSNGLGQVLSVVTKATAGGTQTSKVARQYEYWGSPSTETQQLGDANGDSRTVEYGFDAGGRVSKLYWPHTGTAGDYVEYSNFDGLNRWRTVANNLSDTGTTAATYTFLGGRPATKEYPQSDSTKTVRQTFWSASESNYDQYGRLTASHVVRDPAGTPVDLVKISYAYDVASNPTWRYDEVSQSAGVNWSQSYEYDALDRLVKAEQGAVSNWPTNPTMTASKTWVWNGTQGGTTYTLDKVGNWAKFYNNGTDDTRTHNAINQIATRNVGGTQKNPAYDATGNQTDDGESFKFVYDCRNRLVQAKRRGDDSLLAAYSYDGLGRRIRKIVYDTDGSTELSDTRFLYDGWRIVEERDENDSHELRARYIFGQLYIDEPIRMDRDTGGNGNVYDAGDTNVYYLQDRLFNVVALTDTTGAAVERTWFEPYGKATFTNGNFVVLTPPHRSEQASPFAFTGQCLDAETDLMKYRHRDYATQLGRFNENDPLSGASRTNTYEYADSNPETKVDPEGTIVLILAGLGQDYKHSRGSTYELGEDVTAAVYARVENLQTRVLPKAYVLTKFTTGMFNWYGYNEQVLEREYDAWAKRKRDHYCSLEQFVVVGHSDGATAIWRKRDIFNRYGPWGTPAYIGLLDLVRLSHLEVNDKDDAPVAMPHYPGTLVENYYEISGKTFGWKGRYVKGAIHNYLFTTKKVALPGKGDKVFPFDFDHWQMVTDARIRATVAIHAGNIYAGRARAEAKAKGIEKVDVGPFAGGIHW